MATVKDLQKEIRKIKARNKRVEDAKAWETSWERRGLIFILTYIVIAIFFYYMKLPNPLINAIVPALAFVLSTLTLSFFQKLWIKKFCKK